MKTPHEIAYELMQADPELKLKDAVERGYIKAHDALTARVAALEAALRDLLNLSDARGYLPGQNIVPVENARAALKGVTGQSKAVEAEQAGVRG